MTLLTPPPLDPTRALHVAAMDSLISATLAADTAKTTQPAARALLRRLQTTGLAEINEHGGHYFIKIHGITGTGDLFAELLKGWQDSARLRLALAGWPE